MTPYVLKKWMRALEISRVNRLPYVSFVESAGADLRMQGAARRREDGAPAGARTEHFAESGRFFYDMIELSKLRIPTVCVVFGSSTAGAAEQHDQAELRLPLDHGDVARHARPGCAPRRRRSADPTKVLVRQLV